MSARNGDKSRHQINRKRAVVRRAKIRQMMARRGGEGATGSEGSEGSKGSKPSGSATREP